MSASERDCVQPGEVELVIRHLPGCGCHLTTPDPEATLVQLGCVVGYLVNRAARSVEPFEEGMEVRRG